MVESFVVCGSECMWVWVRVCMCESVHSFHCLRGVHSYFPWCAHVYLQRIRAKVDRTVPTISVIYLIQSLFPRIEQVNVIFGTSDLSLPNFQQSIICFQNTLLIALWNLEFRPRKYIISIFFSLWTCRCFTLLGERLDFPIHMMEIWTSLIIHPYSL